MRRLTTACAVMGALAFVAAACGSSNTPSGGGAAAPKVYNSIGQGEGGLLVRDGDIDAAEPGSGQRRPDERRAALRRATAYSLGRQPDASAQAHASP